MTGSNSDSYRNQWTSRPIGSRMSNAIGRFHPSHTANLSPRPTPPPHDPTVLPYPDAIHTVDRSGASSDVALGAWMALNVSRRLLPGKSLSLAALVAGTPRRENGAITNAVLLVPGFPETAETYAHQIRAAAMAGLYVIAVNPPGFVGSGVPAKPTDLGPGPAADELAGMLERHGIKQAVCVGHDWGASIVTRMVTQPHTQKYVAALGLLNNGWPTSFLNAIFNDPTQRRASRYVASLGASDALAYVQANDFELFRNAFARTAGRGAYTANERKAAVDRMRNLETLDTMLQWYRNLLLVPGLNDALLATTPRELADARAKFDAFVRTSPFPPPAVFNGPAGQILGGNDPYTTGVASKVPREAVPNLKTQVLPTTSHFSHREDPGVVNTLILRLAREAGMSR